MWRRLRQRRSRSPTCVAPAAVRHEARPLARQVDARRLAQPEAVGHLLQRLAFERVEVAAERVEEDVRGDLDRARQAERPVDLLARVAERLLRGADLDAARVVDRRARRDDPLAEGGEGRDRLERRAGRIQAADRAVEPRRAGVRPEQLLEALLGDRAREDRRVVRRVRAHREDLAVARVERDERARRARARGDRLVEDGLAGALEVEVERRAQGAARDRVALLRRALRPPERVDRDALGAVDAPQVAVVGALDALLADDRALADAAEARELELARADLADGALELGAEVAVRVAAQVDLLDVDAGVLGAALEQVVADGRRDVGLDRHARVRHEGQRPHDALLDRPRRHVQRTAQALEAQDEVRRRRVGDPDLRALLALRAPGPRGHLLAPRGGGVALGDGQPLGVELHDGRDAVLDERLAVAVEHRAARRLDAQLAHAVVARLAQVLVAREHLQVPEAEEHDAEQREREHAEDRHAQGELRGDGRHAPGAASVEGAHARLSGDRPPVV